MSVCRLFGVLESLSQSPVVRDQALIVTFMPESAAEAALENDERLRSLDAMGVVQPPAAIGGYGFRS